MKAVLAVLVALLFAGMRPNGTKVLVVGMTGLLLLTMLVPQPAVGQFGGLTGITGILNTVNQAAGKILSFIQDTMRPILEATQSAAQILEGILSQFRRLWEEVVWPISEINRAKALAQQLIGTFRASLNGLYSISVNSAQLLNSIQLEGLMRNHQVNDHDQLAQAFAQTFGALPVSSDVHPEDRTLMDIDDALAINQLMTLKMGDASSDLVLQAAEAVENEATRFAPGTAAMASAAAHIAALQSQAHMQKMIAGQLRQEAARLAHDTMTLKRGVAFTRDSRNRMSELNR